MNKAEVLEVMRQLRQVFDIVRLVDVSISMQLSVDEAGNLTSSPYRCYAVWKKTQRCENCVSARAIACKGVRSKFEFVDNSIYYVISKYMELDGMPYTMELVSEIDDETLMGAYGKTEFIQAITKRNEKLYVDSLTGVYNRRYYDDQLQYLLCKGALAIVDVDNFKSINDTFGHLVGDKVLQKVAWVLRHSVRDTDAVARYGGDEFIIILQDFPAQSLGEKLEHIRADINNLSIDELDGRRVTVSIGGVCWQGPAGEALGKADSLLYQAKEKKNLVVV